MGIGEDVKFRWRRERERTGKRIQREIVGKQRRVKDYERGNKYRKRRSKRKDSEAKPKQENARYETQVRKRNRRGR